MANFLSSHLIDSLHKKAIHFCGTVQKGMPTDFGMKLTETW
jgi:hypothetical protein